jgi:murein DD-endopeptidase MepM/ murein hydrolase activator NlpD
VNARRAILLVLFLTALVAVRNVAESPTFAAFQMKLLMPYRIAKFYSMPPDATILMPVAGVRRAAIADTWQAPRPGGRTHEGQDIFARLGTPVISATDGIVVRIGSGGLGGNTVHILGAGGRTYYYAHLSAYVDPLETGQQVRRGEIIGYVGNTGNARGTSPHLHFGIYTSAGAVNPFEFAFDDPPSSLRDTASLRHRERKFF